MDQVIEFFSGIFDTSKWPPRWYCGEWSDFHGWLYIFGDLVIWFAYMCIPIILIKFISKKDGVPLPKVFMLFGAFIMFCGFTHLLDAIIFWKPLYRFAALIKGFTALISIATVIALIKYFNQAVGLKTSQEFGHELNYRKQAMNELERSNNELQEFAFVASHDLQSPIKTISAYLGFIKENYKDGLDERGQKMINTTIQASERMQVLINDLLEFSRVGQTKDHENLDLDELIESVITDIHEDSGHKAAVIDYKGLPTINANKTDIRRIFSNLIENGCKYQKEGSRAKIAVGYKENEDEHEFYVKDNGIGIPEEYQSRIFQIFQRLHTKDEYEGTGIGLAIVAKIIETYGGKIWIESKVGEGSTFKFTIPKEIKSTLSYQN